MSCQRSFDAGAYVLAALDDDEAAAFAAHLPACKHCRDEVDHLRHGAEALALAVPQLQPPPALRDRIMRDVQADAALLAPRKPAPQPRRRWSLGLQPLTAAACACALVAFGAAGAAVIGGDDGPSSRTLAADVAPPGAKASLRVDGARGTLELAGMSNPGGGRVYQVWLVKGDGPPRPTHTLFTVRRDGRASVQIDAPIKGVREILVSAEPPRGSDAPTSAPVIRATPA
jgi:anti-sigma-K factor RskA